MRNMRSVSKKVKFKNRVILVKKEKWTANDFKADFSKSILEREYIFSGHRDYLWDLLFLRKMSKYFSKKGGGDLKTLKLINSSFRKFKKVSRVNPVFILGHIIHVFLIHVEFDKITRYGTKYDVPRVLEGDDIAILRTLKLFCSVLKVRSKWGGDFETRLLIELLLLLSNAKKSEFVTKGLTPHYNKVKENSRYVHFKW